MKAKEDFILRQIAEEYLLIPVGEAALRMNGLLGLSESGYLLFQRLQSDCTREDLVQVLLGEYDVSPETAALDVDAFLNTMRRLDMLEE